VVGFSQKDLITRTGNFTNKIRIKNDNKHMTDKDIEKIAQRVAQLLYERAHADLSFVPPNEDEEQTLLAELARLMTLLSSYLEKEEYQKCAVIQNKIKRIEIKLNKL
jgi:protein-arginine kinase activator protein McsA